MKSSDSLRLLWPTLTLDWMLQSTQVDDVTLAEALVERFHQGLSCLAEAILGDPASARQVACETIAWAVLNRRQFWNETPLKPWLYSRALRLCRHVLLHRKLLRVFSKFTLFLLHPVRKFHTASPALYFPDSLPGDTQELLAFIQSLLDTKRSRTGFALSAREIALSSVILGLIFLFGWLGKLWVPEPGASETDVIIQTRIVMQVVVVEPGQTPLPTVTFRKFTYRIQPGDTLEKIGALAGVSSELLRNQTGLTGGMAITPGMLIILQIPDSPSSPAASTPTPVPTRQALPPLH